MPVSEETEKLIRRYHRCYDGGTVYQIETVGPDGITFLARVEDEEGNALSFLDAILTFAGTPCVMVCNRAHREEEAQMVAAWLEAAGEDCDEEDNEHDEQQTSH